MDFGAFLDVVRALERAEVEYILVNGVAVNLHGVVRATEDVDSFVRPERKNVERLKAALRSLWDDPEIDEIRAEGFEVYPTLRYGPPAGGFVIDIAHATRDRVPLRGPGGRASYRGWRLHSRRDARDPGADEAGDGSTDRQGRRRRTDADIRLGGKALMPIQRFQSLEEAREALWVRRDDPGLSARIRSLWTFASCLAPGDAPRGVRRFRSPEEAQRDRDEWVTRRAHALRARRLES